MRSHIVLGGASGWKARVSATSTKIQQNAHKSLERPSKPDAHSFKYFWTVFWDDNHDWGDQFPLGEVRYGFFSSVLAFRSFVGGRGEDQKSSFAKMLVALTFPTCHPLINLLSRSAYGGFLYSDYIERELPQSLQLVQRRKQWRERKRWQCSFPHPPRELCKENICKVQPFVLLCKISCMEHLMKL